MSKVGPKDEGRVVFTVKDNPDNLAKERELPFVVGVVADLSGNAPTKKPKTPGEIEAIDVDRTNFNDVMAGMGVGVTMPDGPDLISETDKPKDLVVRLQMNSMDDFDPVNVAKQIPGLKELLELRAALEEARIRNDPEVTDLLTKVLTETEGKAG